jgi:phage-related holin
MNWGLLLLLTVIAVGDAARYGGVATAVWALVVLLMIQVVTGEMARSRGRSVPAWAGWAAVIGPLAPLLLLVVGPKARADGA